MLAETQLLGLNGVFTADNIEFGSSIESAVGFVEQQFAEFAAAVLHDINVTAKTSEDTLVGMLCIFLNRKAGEFPFHFHHQYMENYSSGASPKVDIGTMHRFNELVIGDKNYGLNNSFFSIEAKRLPSPKSDREREYVIGKDKPRGGIERFKKGIHGKDLYRAAIIAFVQGEDYNHWFAKVNDWISDLIVIDSKLWKHDDKLIAQSTVYDLQKFTSHNYRVAGNQCDYIDLIHFWIKVVA